MLERVLAHLRTDGVDEAVLSLGYRPDAFFAAYPDHEAAGVRLDYAVESSCSTPPAPSPSWRDTPASTTPSSW